MKLYSILALLGLILCTGCTPEDLTPVQRNTICNAWVGPFRYITHDPTSGRYSGHVLALDLKVRNQIGEALRCPLYKVDRHVKSSSWLRGRQVKYRQ